MFGKALIWIAKEAAPLIPEILNLCRAYKQRDREAMKRAIVKLAAEAELREMEERRGG